MAKSIRLIERKIPTEEERQAESMKKLNRAISDNSEAIIAFIDILKELNEAGALDIARGALKNRQQIEAIGMEFINVANIPTMLKNVILMSQFLGKLDPQRTEKLIGGLSTGLDAAMRQEEKPRSAWGLLGMLRDRNVTASLSTLMNFMKGMGGELNRHEAKAKAPHSGWDVPNRGKDSPSGDTRARTSGSSVPNSELNDPVSGTGGRGAGTDGGAGDRGDGAGGRN